MTNNKEDNFDLSQCDFLTQDLSVQDSDVDGSKTNEFDFTVQRNQGNKSDAGSHSGTDTKSKLGLNRVSSTPDGPGTQHRRYENNYAKPRDENYEEIDPSKHKVIHVSELRCKTLPQLLEIASQYGITNTNRMPKQEIIFSILRNATQAGEFVYSSGVLETSHDGFGFLRSVTNNYVNASDDVYISQSQVKKFNLKTGDTIAGYVRDPRKGERYFSMAKLMTINGHDLNTIKNKVDFDDLVPLYPREKLNFDIMLGKDGNDVSTRIIDLISPLGKGQRALIVAPPRTGKTMLMQNIAHAINTNHPEVYLIVLLVDERPEEVTDMMRSVKGEVVSSTFDESAMRHVALAEIVIAKAKRMVEEGTDVVILLDSITRLARAYNTVVPSSGKVLTGGVDSNALQRPKRFFGAARNTEDGGSLTIIATALVDTGSKMDEVIFEEFKGTGNSEMILDRKLSDRRLFPAMDINKSGTRKEEEMVDSGTLSRMWMLRRIVTKMNDQNSAEALEFLIKKVKDSKNNLEFFTKMNGN